MPQISTLKISESAVIKKEETNIISPGFMT